MQLVIELIVIVVLIVVAIQINRSERNTKAKIAEYIKAAENKGIVDTLSKACHELNQPAQAIMSIVELTMLNVDTTAKTRANRYRTLLYNVDRLGNITKSMQNSLQTKRREQREKGVK